VENLTKQNDELTASNLLLQEKIEEYEILLLSGNGTDTIANLTIENERLKEELLQLQVAYAEIANLTQSLNETNAELEEQVANLTSVIAELEGSC
jgi:FtsZ-binding cell division protein ZapB